ncbi:MULTISPECIES: hypothetical protein [unclassified Coleofasciculus]|uniref:hypothetical protein n=1 Tax=unclassified Coleofasciculus TaxID=2692782 RepID=UPI00187F10D2|nr:MULTISPECIES: hypothetical protein [unclassified Coleofasciculus]MBE9129926.1 hypothetical protein [Coleofasciculus sp. LEGE 07081]MBE9151459.1 hypothetical protein [Coleofasciculus sp. LEGE 07092]
MDIYIQSRGFEQDCDYRWLQVCEGGSTQPQLPPIGLEVSNLIDSETPSVVLERLPDERLLLLVTGIEPEGRVDFLDRPIRIAVAWVGYSADESVLRHLAVHALTEAEQNSLTEQINQALPLGGEYGFEIILPSLQRLVSQDDTKAFTSSQPPTLTPKIGRNSPQLRHQLAQELQTCHLPTQTGILMVVTGIKKRESLEKAGVWRILSTLVEGDDWEEITAQASGWLPNKLGKSADLKNPLMWLTVILSIISYWLAFVFKLLSSNEQALPESRRELNVKPRKTGNESREKP